MNILIVTQHYWPEQFRSTEIAEALVQNGHNVTVLCGLPNYPEGYILDDYKRGKNRKQERNGVKILRVKEIGRRKNILFRILNYWSYPFYGKKFLKKHFIDCDLILTIETSPIMMCLPAVMYAERFKKPLIMYEMDLWPESLLAGGISKTSFVYKHFKKVSSRIYSKCNKILTSTKEHIEYIRSLPCCENVNIDYLPQYAETIFENKKYNKVNDDIIDLMFAGNIGKAQSLDTIIKAAHLLKDNPKYKFHIVGSGTDFKKMKDLADSLETNNVVFYGRKNIDEMPGLYETADVMLVSLEDKTYANITIPGKVQSYMAAGKPLIAAANGSTANFVVSNGIGYACKSGNSEMLASIIENLNLEELEHLGLHARDVYFKKFSKEMFVNKLISFLEETRISN